MTTLRRKLFSLQNSRMRIGIETSQIYVYLHETILNLKGYIKEMYRVANIVLYRKGRVFGPTQHFLMIASSSNFPIVIKIYKYSYEHGVIVGGKYVSFPPRNRSGFCIIYEVSTSLPAVCVRKFILIKLRPYYLTDRVVGYRLRFSNKNYFFAFVQADKTDHASGTRS